MIDVTGEETDHTACYIQPTLNKAKQKYYIQKLMSSLDSQTRISMMVFTD